MIFSGNRSFSRSFQENVNTSPALFVVQAVVPVHPVAEGVMIATTINIHISTMTALSRAAIKLNVTRREIIVRLLMRVMRDCDDYRREFSTVRYQSDDRERRWHCFSIKFKNDENEFFTDLRKLCKCSISLLVAIAVKRYLKQMIVEIEKGVHKYAPFRYYLLQQVVVNGIICWQLYWGNPRKRKQPRQE
jgi:hypothetical protein